MTLERRRRLTHRLLPAAAAVGLAAFVFGLTVGGGHESETERVGQDFAAAWQREDYAAMHRLLSADARTAISREQFAAAYDAAAATATTRRLAIAKPDVDGDVARLPVSAHTSVFGVVHGPVELPVVEGAVDWKPHLVFPGLTAGVALDRRTTAPGRAKLLAADGQVLAEGPPDARTSPLTVASSIAGSVAAPTDEAEREQLYARGFPDDTPVGTSGLERVFERQLAGTPGGELLAGGTVLARSRPRPGKPVRTTIVPSVQEAADVALAGRLGGVAALDPHSGEILALAGVAFSAPQPPGSTFKIVTAAAALEDKKVKLSDEFPIETAATIDGVELANANGESCGGDFANSFAHSCNSVFAPLGVDVGSERLVAEAEQFGWNEDPGIPGALPSTIPPADKIVSPLEIGSTAIGQFQTLATTLQMASVAQTIANGGVRVKPTLFPVSGTPKGVRVVPADVAKTVQKLMVGVVEYGTGTLSQVDGVAVAGKTGTAELGDTRGDDPEAALRDGDPTNTDAWFTAYAPAGKPRVVVSVLLVRNGSGGSTAAPAAQGVIVAGLKATP
jgi:peptidoglycan glycosyltransferase